MAQKKSPPAKTAVKEEPIKFTFQAKIEMVDVGELTPDPENPRLIKRKDFDRLVTSIRDNPNMLMIRPIVYGKSGKIGKKIYAGDKRYKAAIRLGLKKVPAINVTNLSKKEIEHFRLWDNENVGTWDFDALENWGDTFGINLPDKKDPHKFNDGNAEMPIVPKYDEKYYAVLIVVESEMDFANLCTVMDLGHAKDYKTETVRQTQVIDFKDFMKRVEAWKKSK